MPRPPYEYSPITEREFDLPNGENVAFWVVPNIEWFQYDQPRELHQYVEEPPDVNTYSELDYGNRVGVWRMMEILDRYDVRGTVALNSMICEEAPEIVEAGVERDWEFMGHGRTNSRPLSGLSEDEERELIRDVRDQIAETTDTQPRGWLGPARAESFRTPELLAEAGFDYVGDWVNDDQPYRMDVSAGELYSIPYSTVISDKFFTDRKISGPQWEQMVTDQFDVLYEEGEEAGNAKVMAISLHPYLIGFPYRSKYLDRALDHITGHDDVWVTTGSEIVDHFREHYD
ncbi:MAG: polysaccharide deacetylase family protein [Haloferacaceae archaeon]